MGEDACVIRCGRDEACLVGTGGLDVLVEVNIVVEGWVVVPVPIRDGGGIGCTGNSW